jgi:hypothetical protein
MESGTSDCLMVDADSGVMTEDDRCCDCVGICNNIRH